MPGMAGAQQPVALPVAPVLQWSVPGASDQVITPATVTSTTFAVGKSHKRIGIPGNGLSFVQVH